MMKNRFILLFIVLFACSSFDIMATRTNPDENLPIEQIPYQDAPLAQHNEELAQAVLNVVAADTVEGSSHGLRQVSILLRRGVNPAGTIVWGESPIDFVRATLNPALSIYSTSRSNFPSPEVRERNRGNMERLIQILEDN